MTLAATPTSGSEAAGTTITLTATASAAVTGVQTVALSLSGTGLTASDFVGAIPSSLTIADGATSASVTLQVADDALAEGLETAVFTIANPSSGIALGATKTASVAITDNDGPPAPQVVYRWAAGPTTVAATDGGPAWTADASVVKGGPTALFAGGITGLHASAAGTPVGLFANERYDVETGAEMGLDFGTGLAAGAYTVRLFLADTYDGTKTVGSRVFDVLIENGLAFDNVDLVARFGHKTGGMLEWTGQVTDGRVDIDFVHMVQNPLINGVGDPAGRAGAADGDAGGVADGRVGGGGDDDHADGDRVCGGDRSADGGAVAGRDGADGERLRRDDSVEPDDRERRHVGERYAAGGGRCSGGGAGDGGLHHREPVVGDCARGDQDGERGDHGQ